MAAFLSATVGGEVSDRDTICPMVSLEGENVGSVALHLDCTCVFRFFRATTSEQDAISHVRRSSHRTLMSKSGAAGYEASEASEMVWTPEQEVQGRIQGGAKGAQAPP